MKRGTILILIAVMLLTLCACGTTDAEPVSEEASAVEESTSESVQEPAVKLIGTETDSPTAVMMEVLNSTGQDITSWKVKLTGAEAYSENMLEGSFVAKETRILFVDPENDNENRLCDVELEIAGESHTIHNFPLDDAEEMEICLSDGIVYLQYPSITTGKYTNTLDDEKALIAAEAAKSAPASSGSSSSGSGSYSGSSGSGYSGYSGSSGSTDYSGSSGGSDGGSDDGCIGDDGLLY